MKKMKFLSFVTVALLLTAPLTTAAFATDGTTTTGSGTTTGTGTSTGGTTAPTDGSTSTGGTTTTGTGTSTGGTTDPTGGSTSTGGTTTTDGGSSAGGTGVCQSPSGDGEGEGSTGGTTAPTGGTTTGSGTTTSGGTTTGSGTATGSPTAPTSDGSGTTTTTGGGSTGTGDIVVPQMDHDHGDDHGNENKSPSHFGDGGWGNWGSGWNNWGKNNNNGNNGTTTGTGVSGQGNGTLCAPHDNGKHLGWSKKIDNMLKHLDQLKKAITNFQNELDQLLQWAKQDGSTSDQQALSSVQDSLYAKVNSGAADIQDMQTLAETQDQLNNTDSAVQTIEQALKLAPSNQDLYKQLSQKFVKKGDHSVKVFVKGAQPNFDVKPTIVNGHTMVPLRAIGDALHAKVGWDEATQTVTLQNQDGKLVKLTLNSKVATVDGKTQTLEVPATSEGGRTLVPLRALGNFFGLNVGWDSNAQMAILD